MKKLLILVLLVFSSMAIASAKQYKAGVDYTKIESPQPTHSGKKIEVIEFFWYGCPHCFHFEPYISQWNKTKSKNVAFVRIPAVFRPGWKVQARAYYALQQMGVIESVHDKIFDEIHKHRNPLDTVTGIADFVAKQGVNRAKFIQEYNSFAVDGLVRKAVEELAAYKINGVPTVVVNGKYMLSGRLAGTYEKLIKILNYLIKKESAAPAAHK